MTSLQRLTATAYNLLNDMDTNVDPCDDFYAFACGAFTERTVIPDERSSVTSFYLLGNEIEIKMRKLIDTPVSTDDTSATVLLKKYFNSCMNKETIEKRGLQPLHDILAKMGGWPVLNGSAWDDAAFHWTEAVYRNRKLGYSQNDIFWFGILHDLKDPTRNIISLFDPALGFERASLIRGFNDSDVQAYYGYMVDMAVLLGAEPGIAKQDMEAALHFKMQLANMSLAKEELRDVFKLYHKMTLDELSLLAPTIPWVTYANKLLEDVGHQLSVCRPTVEHLTRQSVGSGRPVEGWCCSPPYLPAEHLAVLRIVQHSYMLYRRNERPCLRGGEPARLRCPLREPAHPRCPPPRAPFTNRVQANYLLWRVVEASVSQLNLASRDARLKLFGQVYGTTEHGPRWKQCLDDIMHRFGIPVGSLYVKNHFDQDSKTAVLKLVSDIHKEFDAMLLEAAWIDRITRQRAIQKSKAMTYYIAYPNELLNDTMVSELYEDLQLTDDDFFKNMLDSNIFNTNYFYSKLREHADKNDWREFGEITAVNAFAKSTNGITFPAGILQGTFYSNDRPKYMNYGAIGFLIGHEITHLFDDKGRQFNAEGKLQEWWEPETRSRFLDSVQCIIDQYGNITVDRVNMQVNGILTQGENIADNGGIRMARRAYDRYQSSEGREPALPGLQQYTSEQMFWLGTVNTWCAVYREEGLRQVMRSSNHAPSFVRMNTAIKNTEQFARDWQCPAGSRMNPVDGCRVW
ncbi:neprilysin-2-like [Pollicipes pollicipes]|uniref:neprilysin-2-like n=1 Tax=Pollicipes pollicipes TaxID=41117 RepID=UPI0018852608|nr:neprilysin-2-like [Pollicipes pollicipes]